MWCQLELPEMSLVAPDTSGKPIEDLPICVEMLQHA